MATLIRSADFGLELAEVARLGAANGITDWLDRIVVVRKSLSGVQRFKTAVHELAHIRLHEPSSGERPDCRGIIEVEAESVAYMVCAALGVDSAGYSLPYVATWSGGNLEKVSETADRVIRCARGMITDLELDQRLVRDRSVAVVTGRGQRNEKRSLDGTPADGRVRVAELEEALRVAVSYYQDRLDGSSEARSFLETRGTTMQSAERWQLGYAAPRWDGLVNALRNQNISDEVLVEAGLAGRARTGRVYDRMRGRIIFPIHDAQGSPRGLAGRLITGQGPKYLNSPQTVLYQKSELLYGLHHAADTITEQRHAVVVEGYTDAIAAHQTGLANTVATGERLSRHRLLPPQLRLRRIQPSDRNAQNPARRGAIQRGLVKGSDDDARSSSQARRRHVRSRAVDTRTRPGRSTWFWDDSGDDRANPASDRSRIRRRLS